MRTYYSQVFRDGSVRAAKQYRSATQLLLSNPWIGVVVEDSNGVRELVIPSTPFSLVYRVTDNQIQVLRIWDQRRDRGHLFF